MKIQSSHLLATVLYAAALLTVPTGSHAADVQVQVSTSNSGTNGGPFTAGAGTTFQASFRIDASVVPSGGVATWASALDDLNLTIQDSVLGAFAVSAQNGRYQQLGGGAGTDFMFGGWGGVHGGTLSALSVTNPALSATPFFLESISFDFRGPNLFSGAQSLPGTLNHSAGGSDFDFLDLTLRFTNTDPAMILEKTAIIRKAAFSAIEVSPVPEPATVSMLLGGALLIGALARRRV